MSLFQYRELIRNLVVSDLKVKYANSVFGFAWSLLNPLLMLLILYFVFSNVFRSEEHFAVYILIGLLAWRFFAIGTNSALNSIVGKQSLVTKIFIPRQILTLSSVLSSLVSSTLEFAVVVPILVVFGDGLKWTIVLFPVVQLLFFLVIYGLSLMLSSMYVYFRDLNQIWDVFLQLGMFMSPIVYPASIIPAQYQPAYLLNPITCAIGMYRDIFLYGSVPGLYDLAIVVASILVLVPAGTLTFNRLSRRFAEEV